MSNQQEKITSLTDEQRARMPLYVEKWTKIGLSTDPTDHDGARRCIAECYKNAGYTPPIAYFHFSSPDAAAHGATMIDILADFDPKKDTTATVNPAIEPFMNVFENMFSQYKEQYESKSGFQWTEDVKQQMLSKISNVYADTNKRSNLLNSHFDKMMFNNHDAAWLAFYDFWNTEFQLEATKPLEPSFELATKCGWWSSYEQHAIYQDRPTEIHFDEEKRLHNLSGPAIAYPNNDQIYCIEGHYFPANVVEAPSTITVKQIDDEQNAEKRRILLQQLGFDKYLSSASCSIIDQDETQVSFDDPRMMPRMLIKTKHGDLYLVGTDGSTKRTYFMNVGNTENRGRGLTIPNTCREAHQFISGFSEDNCIGQS